ncbi:hypothetical protein L486_07294 [Kwoniella mangroviensis CBS 10435]|uniref:Uncharacterized protein n=1 Tax=Kwoniella mangroviensis CBS 10435 TaxID=1331196 RepID=A0A1B9IIE7_9TREE|nr:hypothetical protein L486_07294 [Kwoniella mangroviensis CBS 10435]
MPSSTLPTYYLPPPHGHPPPHSSHLSPSVPSPKPRRPTVFDDLFTDLITSLDKSTSDLSTSREDIGIAIPSSSPMKSKYLGVDNDLHLLKHSISERNLSDSRRSAQDLNLVDKLMEDHKKELKEFEKVKQQLKEERELNSRLKMENHKMKEQHEQKIEEMKKANKKALKILMGLQREEFLNWSNGLKPYINQIDQAVRDRINNWEKSVRVRTSGYQNHGLKEVDKNLNLDLERRRSSSPEPEPDKTGGSKSPSKSTKEKTIRRTRRVSGLGIGENEKEKAKEKHPFARQEYRGYQILT